MGNANTESLAKIKKSVRGIHCEAKRNSLSWDIDNYSEELAEMTGTIRHETSDALAFDLEVIAL